MSAEPKTDKMPTTGQWKALGISGGGAALILSAIGYFNSQFGEIRKDQAEVRAIVHDMRSKQSDRSREIEFRLERVEEWRKLLPDGVGLDRWTGKSMEIWALRMQRDNPSLAVPRLDDLKQNR